jgi:Rieske Fe-S protein
MTEKISRRSALAGAGAVVVGGVIGGVVANNSAAAHEPNGTVEANAYGNTPSGGTALAELGKIPDGGGVILSSPPVVITRSQSGAVHAFSAICTHQGCHVDRVADGKIFCPCHGSVFDATTGAVVGGPAPRPLPKVAVKIRSGEVYSA